MKFNFLVFSFTVLMLTVMNGNVFAGTVPISTVKVSTEGKVVYNSPPNIATVELATIKCNNVLLSGLKDGNWDNRVTLSGNTIIIHYRQVIR
jgi:hypothetical protein